MNASKTLTALIAAATIAGTATLVYAQTAIDSGAPAATTPAVAGNITPDRTLPADSGRSTMPPSTLPSDATRSMLPAQGGAITTPGYSSGATTSYPDSTASPGNAPSDRGVSSTSAVPAPMTRTAPMRSDMSTTAPSGSSEPLPRSDRH
ncbi:MAG: hypothetical protein ABIX46_08130 [Burkholderiaceae bacterium]